MNKLRLRAAENQFLLQFPEGFSDPEMIQLSKKHQASLRIKQAQEFFSPESFSNPQLVAENMVKTISRSSIVSVFEKPKLRDWVKGMTYDERQSYAYALQDMLHGDQEYGFNMMLSLLEPARLAKWVLMTVIPAYYAPLDEVFVKPTTVKGVINYFELPDLVYKPAPSYEFYIKYRAQFIAMREMVDTSLAPHNPAFSGFLMMTTQK